MADVGFSEVAAAVALRWTERSLNDRVTGGIRAYQAEERTQRPYAILTPTGDSLTRITNRSQYDEIGFRIEVIADNGDELGPLVGYVKEAYKVDLQITQLNGAVTVSAKYNRTDYFEEANYVRAVIDFSARVRQNR